MKFIILDRDGVINEDSDDFIKSPEEWIPIPGSIEAISKLCAAEYKVVVISNQSGIARGLLSLNTLNKIHQKMIDLIDHQGGRLEAIFFCPHGPDDACSCRKPKTGLFVEFSKRIKHGLKGIPTVGDSIRDLEAAISVGAEPILVKTGKGKRSIELIERGSVSSPVAETPQFENLADFVDQLLSGKFQVSCEG